MILLLAVRGSLLWDDSLAAAQRNIADYADGYVRNAAVVPPSAKRAPYERMALQRMALFRDPLQVYHHNKIE